MRTRLSSTLFGTLTLFALAAASGCGSSATTVTSPTTLTRCAVTAGSNSSQLPPQGGTGSVAVSAARECAWSASVEGQWLTIKNGSTGQGEGAVEFTAAANPDPAIRRGAIVLNDSRVEVVQAAAECTYTLSESSRTFGQTGGQGAFEVRASSVLCTWSVQADSPWIQLRSGTSGKGSAAVEFEIAPGTGVSRTGTITAAGLRFSVTQTAALACSYTISPESVSIPSGGGSGRVTVSTASGCAWSASSTASWLEIVGGASGSGSGEVAYQAGPSTSTRSAALTIAGRTFTVNQSSADCSFSISPEQLSAGAPGGTSTVNVTAQSGCAWSMSSSAPWITLRSNGPENGAGAVQVTVAANTGAARVGTAIIAGRTLTVSQAAAPVSSAPCSYKVGPLEVKANDDGALRRVEIETADGCAWTASSNTSWIRLGLTTSGTGNGEVFLIISGNEGPERTGTVTVAGQTVTVTQKGD